MLKKLLFGSSVFLSLFMVFYVVSSHTERMPLVQDDPYSHLVYGAAPIEQRDIGVRKWLVAGVKINVRGASGSGTIVYYDERNNTAFIQSCGHLWNGSMNAEQCSKKKISCTINVWYHNQEKLPSPKSYPADVIYYNNGEGQDCSLLKFTPDWSPDYFPIAPKDFQFTPNMRLHSVGCDGGSEVAHYDVRVVGLRTFNGQQDLVTTENSPRPGRSGGGLMNDDFYVAICWGTSDYQGVKNGFFTPLETVRAFNEKNGYGWLNEVGNSLARQIPIIDRNNPQGKYPKDYVPLPSR